MTSIHHKFSNEEKEYIFKNYKDQNARQLSDNINKIYHTNITMKQVQTFKTHNKLKSGKPFEYWKLPLTEKQRQSRANNLLKYNLTKSIKVGDKSIDHRGYVRIKQKDGTYEYQSRLVYKKYHGTIPENYVILHLDGNNKNDKISNLVAIPKGYMEFIRYKGLCFKNKELTKVAVMTTELLFKANKRKKELNIIEK